MSTTGVRIQAQLANPASALLQLAVRVDIVTAQHTREKVANRVVGQQFFEGVVPVRRKHGLGAPAGPDGFQDGPGPGMQRCFVAADFVAADEFRPDDVERIAFKIKPEPTVIVHDGKIKDLEIAGLRERGHRAFRQQTIHHLDAKGRVIQERAIPVPDDVLQRRMHYEACRR
jgi:hypothetical protein